MSKQAGRLVGAFQLDWLAQVSPGDAFSHLHSLSQRLGDAAREADRQARRGQDRETHHTEQDPQTAGINQASRYTRCLGPFVVVSRQRCEYLIDIRTLLPHVAVEQRDGSGHVATL